MHMERKCADTISTVFASSLGWPYPVQKNINTFFSNKIYGNNFIEASTRKPLWFETAKILTAA